LAFFAGLARQNAFLSFPSAVLPALTQAHDASVWHAVSSSPLQGDGALAAAWADGPDRSRTNNATAQYAVVEAIFKTLSIVSFEASL
jgi:hypothetical protein